MYRHVPPALLLISVVAGVPSIAAVSSEPSAVAPSQASASADTLHRPFDQVLDTNVRDGFVYYRALKSERGRLDRYAASLNVAATAYDAWPREEKMAFW